MRDDGSDSRTSPPAAPARRLAWFVAIWAGGVVALGVVAWLLRLLMSALGLGK